jgi:hypothetical protein
MIGRQVIGMSSPDDERGDEAEALAQTEHGTDHEGKNVTGSPSEEQSIAANEIDLVAALGASIELSPQVLRLYIPDKDRHSNEFGCQRKWVLEASSLLAKIGGGVTMLPPSEGGWYDRENDSIVWESPILVYTYVKPDLFEKHLPELRRFLHRLGRETNQGEVALEFDGDFYRINEYDAPEGA